MLIGIDNSEVNNKIEKPKGIGISTTLALDACDIKELEKVLLHLTEQVCFRLRKKKMNASVVNVQLRTKDFVDFSHQEKLMLPTSSTKEIYGQAKKLLSEMYRSGLLIRLIGIRLDKLSDKDEGQISLFDYNKNDKQEKLDKTIDSLKQKYGFSKISRATDINQNGKSNSLYKD